MQFVAKEVWRESPVVSENSRSCQEAETESKDQNAKPSCEIMSLQKFPHLLPVKKHPELSGPLKGVFPEGQFCSFWEYSGCFTLPQSSLMCLIHMHMSKFSNGYKDGDPGGRNAMFTSTETRWVAEKGGLADFWNGIWYVTPPASGIGRSCPQPSGLSSCPRNSGDLYDFQWVHS